MAKFTDVQKATRYFHRETFRTKKTSWKGCEFCKKPILPNEEAKPGKASQQNAHIACVLKLTPEHIKNPPKVDRTKPSPVKVIKAPEVKIPAKAATNPKPAQPSKKQEAVVEEDFTPLDIPSVTSDVIDMSKSTARAHMVMHVQPDYAKLLEQAQENVRFSQQQLHDAIKRSNDLVEENKKLTEQVRWFQLLGDECLKLVQAGKVTNSPMFAEPRAAIKRVLVWANLWVD